MIGQAGYGRVLARQDPSDPASRLIEIPGPNHADALAVVDAYRETGSVMRASKLLQSRGIPAPRGGKKWGTHTITNILEREAPDLFPRKARTSGRRIPAKVWYAQLVVCHCGATMSPNRPRHQLYCPWGHRLGAAIHGRMTISENKVRAFVDAELDHFALPADTYTIEVKSAARRSVVNARLERMREMRAEGDIDKARWEAEKARHAADMATLDDRETVVELPDRNELWTYADRDISRILRSIFLRIDLSTEMMPLATWRNRKLRRS